MMGANWRWRSSKRPTPALTTPTAVVVTPESTYGVFRRPVNTTGWRSWLFTIDHKKLGIMYGTTAFAFFILGGIEALMIRVETRDSERDVRLGGRLGPTSSRCTARR